MTINVCLIHEDARTTSAQAETIAQAKAWTLHVAEDPFFTSNGRNPVIRVFFGGDAIVLEEMTVESLRTRFL